MTDNKVDEVLLALEGNRRKIFIVMFLRHDHLDSETVVAFLNGKVASDYVTEGNKKGGYDQDPTGYWFEEIELVGAL